MTRVEHGRCKSGSRWFWYAAVLDYDYPRCEDAVCVPGLHPHEYGWEETEDLALKVMAETVARLGGEVRKGAYRGNAPGSARAASAALKRVNAARRRARPPKQGVSEAAPVEYLYEPWSWSDYDNPPYETHKGIREIPVVKKTARRIYYDNSSSWDREDGVVTLGYISREEFETDARCRADCPRDILAGLMCATHSRDFPHGAHFGTDDWYLLRCYDRGRHGRTSDCGGPSCPLDVPGRKCTEHGYTWEHCPHRSNPGACQHGYPADAARLPDGSEHYGGGTVYATREAAEEDLHRWEREQEAKRKEREPELKQLRREMADAHPDRGGTNEGFMAARQRYERALRKAS